MFKPHARVPIQRNTHMHMLSWGHTHVGTFASISRQQSSLWRQLRFFPLYQVMIRCLWLLAKSVSCARGAFACAPILTQFICMDCINRCLRTYIMHRHIVLSQTPILFPFFFFYFFWILFIMHTIILWRACAYDYHIWGWANTNITTTLHLHYIHSTHPPCSPCLAFNVTPTI